jgi:hypothetical protein
MKQNLQVQRLPQRLFARVDALSRAVGGFGFLILAGIWVSILSTRRGTSLWVTVRRGINRQEWRV